MIRDLYQIPMLGYALKTFAIVFRLPTRLIQVQQMIENHSRDSAAAFQAYRQAADSRMDTIEHGMRAIEHRLLLIENRVPELDLLTNRVDDLHILRREVASLSAAVSRQSHKEPEPADDSYLDAFYRDFEERFRGDRALIRSRCQNYIPLFQNAGIDFEKHPVIDVGCGRGEWLELLKENGIRSKGIDINAEMVAFNRSLSLEADQEDVLEFLGRQPSRSLGAITGFHIVEHLPLSILIRLFDECHRTLCDGGMILFETPNPENLRVGSCNFYLDPTHKNPIPPETLRFMVEQRNFKRAEIYRSSASQAEPSDLPMPSELEKLVAWSHLPEDYAVIARK